MMSPSKSVGFSNENDGWSLSSDRTSSKGEPQYGHLRTTVLLFSMNPLSSVPVFKTNYIAFPDNPITATLRFSMKSSKKSISKSEGFSKVHRFMLKTHPCLAELSLAIFPRNKPVLSI